MSDSNRIKYSYAKEVTYGTAPAIDFTRLRSTGDSLKQETGSTKSAEIDSGRHTVDIVRNSIRASGAINFELSYSEYDVLLEGALQSPWSAQVTAISANVNVSAAATGNKFVLGTGTWTAQPTTNSWIKVSGFTGAGAVNNGYWHVVSSTTTEIVVDGGTVTTASAGPAVTIIQGGALINSTTFYSFSIEKQYSDLTTEFEALYGMAIDTLALTIPTNDIITGSFGFVGQKALTKAAAIGTGSYTASATNDPMNSIDHVLKTWENYVQVTATEIGVQLANNLRARMQIGTLGAVSVGSGSCAIEGSYARYFDSGALLDKYLNFSESAFAFALQDGNGKGYLFDFPSIKFTDGQRVAGGKDQDIMAAMKWEARKDPTQSVMVRVQRWSA